MKKLLFLILILFLNKLGAQVLSGEVYLKDNSELYLNQVYVTNLSTMKTVLSDYNGDFKIEAKLGDAIRFTSIVTDRRDITVTSPMLGTSLNLFELKIAYYDIQEVVINRFRPTGNLKRDVNSLKTNDKNYAIHKMIGLPAPKGDGLPPQLPVVGFRDGGLSFSIQSIYDILSGERKKQNRYNDYARMNVSITNLRKYFGDAYFTDLKIPKNLIDSFLQFVYSSDNLRPYLDVGNFEISKISMEKYLPIYLKRLRNSNLQSLVDDIPKK